MNDFDESPQPPDFLTNMGLDLGDKSTDAILEAEADRLREMLGCSTVVIMAIHSERNTSAPNVSISGSYAEAAFTALRWGKRSITQ